MDGFAAGAGHEFGPPLPAQQRAGLGHSVAHHIGQVHFAEAALHLRFEGGTAHNEAAHLATESVHHFLAHSLVYQIIDTGKRKQNFQFLHGRLDGVGIDFLHHQRHGDHHIGTHFLHRLEECCGRRGLAQEIYRDAVDVGMDELDGQPIRMGQRQHRDDGLPGLVREMGVAEIVGVGDGTVGEHHTLGVARGAGSIVDDSQIVPII